MNILIVEDTQMMGRAYVDLLNAAGHQVTWIVGVRGLKPLIGIAPDGSDVQLDLSKFDLCFSDGDLGKNQPEGKDVVEVVAAAGVVCVGMSTLPTFNTAMVEKGACAGFNKAVFVLGLIAGELTPEAILADPAKVQNMQERLEVVSKDEEVRRKGDALLLKHVA